MTEPEMTRSNFWKGFFESCLSNQAVLIGVALITLAFHSVSLNIFMLLLEGQSELL